MTAATSRSIAILLVTSSRELVDDWRAALRSRSAEIGIAASPRHALSLSHWREAHRPPCVVLDDAAVSGLADHDYIAELTAKAPVLLLTARDADEVLLTQMRAVGVWFVIPKLGLASASIWGLLASCRASWKAQRLLHDEMRVSDLIHRLSSSLASKLDVGAIVDEIAADATELVDAEQGFFLYHRSENGEPGDTTLRRRRLKQTSPPDDDRFLSELEHLIQTSIDTGSPVRIDDLYRSQWRPDSPPVDASGRLRSCLIVPVQDGSDGHFGALVFAHSKVSAFNDRHERLLLGISAAASIALRNAKLFEQVNKASQAREELMELLSHDLRNPINSIAIACDELRAGELDVDQRGRYLAAMRRALGRCQELIGDLLDVSRIESGKLSVTPSPVPVSSIVERVVLDHELAAVQKQVAIAADCKCLESVSVDRERVHQALSNLVSNALDHSERDSVVTVYALLERREVVLGVVDHGHGICPDELPHVFERFYQASRKRSAGAGLGLAIVDGIARAHGGFVRVDSQLGQGACFELHLPRG